MTSSEETKKLNAEDVIKNVLKTFSAPTYEYEKLDAAMRHGMAQLIKERMDCSGFRVDPRCNGKSELENWRPSHFKPRTEDGTNRWVVVEMSEPYNGGGKYHDKETAEYLARKMVKDSYGKNYRLESYRLQDSPYRRD